MSATRQIMPVVTLVGLLLFAILAAALVVDPEQILPVAAVMFVVMFPFWFMFQGGGLAPVGKDSTVIRKDGLGNIDTFEEGKFPFIPIFHTIEARLPNYPLKHEFTIDTIDTRTPNLNQIKQIKARVIYRVADARACFKESANLIERIKELEEHEKLKREEPGLWKRVLNELIYGTVDDVARDVVWNWDAYVKRDPTLLIDVPFEKKPEPEYDPYALSLNRLKLAQRIRRNIERRFEHWGIEIAELAFETIEIDPELIKRKTRSKDGELKEADHQAQIAAIGISLKGLAEVEVRAATVARVLQVLIDKKGEINLTNDVLYNIVRAAMYSDGQMIWHGTVDQKPSPNGASTAKAA